MVKIHSASILSSSTELDSIPNTQTKVQDHFPQLIKPPRFFKPLDFLISKVSNPITEQKSHSQLEMPSSTTKKEI